MSVRRHLYRVRVRSNDIDLLNHVSNVVYAEYATDAMAAAARDGLLPAVPRVRQLAIDFLAPIRLADRDVVVESAVDGASVRQSFLVHRDGAPVLAARTEIACGPPAALPPSRPGGQVYEHVVRPSDTDGTGSLTAARAFRLVQEARNQLFEPSREPTEADYRVVARTECVLGAPMPWRDEPYLPRSWVDHLGTSSATVVTEVGDEQRVHLRATSVIVSWDHRGRRSRPLTPDLRDRWSRLGSGPAGTAQ
ncbi:thioesterase family protein [Georgenia sp. SYP-B2076]|uniref:acyl-CoA thioesterase n=1 Tax=Georgenia sp. SYP-B2076 TaxID=2495881 RepID=UPI000F8CEEAD|nr:hotdog domain-containing protein [Georgenia sp. SYP-B2076]